MTDPTTPSRRHLLRLLASSALAGVLAPAGIDRVLGRPLDQGIGGTGAAPPPTDESDRGIGGTGVIGTIKKFGSIYVNDLRIAYPANAEIFLDGAPASQADLRIGQVVRVNASGANDAYSTQRIFVTSEVVGPVERTGGRELMVLGQRVSTEGLERRNYALGETVAVSGLRRNDGTIVASLIEPRPDAPPRVAGPILRDERGGGLRVGDLPLDRVDPRLIGARARLEGRLRGDGVFVVRRGYTETSLFPKSVRTLSVESYVERRNGAFALGSGFALAGNPGVEIAEGQSVRAVLTTSIDREGRLSVDGVRAGGRSYRVAPGGGGRGPGGGGGRGGPGGGGRGGPGSGHGGPGEGGRGGSERGHGDHGRGDHGRGGHGRGEHGRGGQDNGRHGGAHGEGRHGGHEGGRMSREPGGRHGFDGGGRGGPGGPSPGGFHGRGPGGFRGGGPGAPGGFRGPGPGGFGGPRGGGGGFRGGGGGGGFHGGGGPGGHR